ncbi:PIG-P-domain-containing protein [Gilbertella persicaria]|uniref:PIG-P domain-containing protein n=1 Tax=Rhizopus stolonifer TaxID=4846 RepID=A0A367KLE8_RHIST|nr:PIG-P-domain-containing protein [Gilbertella persicaria]KAI8087790.1 PIG-P-domain-containing protein [Gilbertella persicaria]RCI02662.1 hypothetical protein CU098_002927 [Rhizopus stolonifer]
MAIKEVSNSTNALSYFSQKSTTGHLVAKNASALSTSRSTSSLPNLVNFNSASALTNIHKKQPVIVRRGRSQQTTRVSNESKEQPKKPISTKRRHSFSSFLTVKFGKKTSMDETIIEYKRTATSIANNIITFSNPTITGRVPSVQFQSGKKGHRPRSYSELPYNLPPVERAPPVATTNKTPAYEYYGFVMYLSSFVAFGIYLIWAYVPDQILHRLGITYYPSRYWALAIPIWLMTFVWFIFLSFMAVNLMNTPSFDSLYCITDEHANLMCMDKEMISDRPSDWMPELHDIPIGLVNMLLYQEEPYMIPTQMNKGTKDDLVRHKTRLNQTKFVPKKK